MIKGICTPCRASDVEDVQRRLSLLRDLKKIFPEKIGICETEFGIEIVGPVSDFLNPDIRKKIINNVLMARNQGIKIVVIHAPIERDIYKTTDLARAESITVLQEVFNLANLLEAELVVTHCEICQPLSAMRKFTDKEREVLKTTIANNLRKLDRTNITLAIENMPNAIDGDVFFSASDMKSFPFFVDLSELHDFTEKNSLFITFDTCHWGTLCIPVPLIEAYKRIQDRVIHIHLNDAWGRWIDGVSRFEEGLIPGDGNLGKENFSQLIAFIKRYDPKYSVTITVEVHDERNSKHLQNSRESFKRLVKWLKT